MNAEQVYINAYVALQEVQDELQAAQTLVNQLSSNAGATNADVIQAIESLFQFVNTKFGEMEERITSNQVVLARLEARFVEEARLAEEARLELRCVQVSKSCWVNARYVF